jgi:hypothetical protein
VICPENRVRLSAPPGDGRSNCAKSGSIGCDRECHAGDELGVRWTTSRSRRGRRFADLGRLAEGWRDGIRPSSRSSQSGVKMCRHSGTHRCGAGALAMPLAGKGPLSGSAQDGPVEGMTRMRSRPDVDELMVDGAQADRGEQRCTSRPGGSAFGPSPASPRKGQSQRHPFVPAPLSARFARQPATLDYHHRRSARLLHWSPIRAAYPSR